MIYQETLKLLKKAASDPYTIDAPTGHSPMDYMTRYWLNNDPKIVDQRNRLNTLRDQDNDAIARGNELRTQSQNEAIQEVKNRAKAAGGYITPAEAYRIKNDFKQRRANWDDVHIRDTYHLNQITGNAWAPNANLNARKRLLMRQNPAHGLNYFNTVGDTYRYNLAK